MGFRHFLLPVLAAAVLAAAVSPLAGAERLTERQRREAESFAVNNTLFFLYHEVGHLLIDQLSLPVLGKEEDAADNMATYLLLRQQSPRASRILTDSARGWLLSGDKYDTEIDKSDYYDAHSFDHQRAYQIVCLMVGSNPKAFGSIADDYEMDEGRQDTCRYDYELVKRSMEGLLGRQWAKGQSNSKIQIVYQPANGEYERASQVFRASGAFENIAHELRVGYELPHTVTLRAQSCGGDPNAYYEADSIEVIFCYELMDDMLGLIADVLPDDTVSADHVGRTDSRSSD